MNEELTEDGLTGGQMTWDEAIAGPLAGATCLWQDLDGLHKSAPPEVAPPTSILWGWREDALVRVRLDGTEAFVAVLSPVTRIVKTVEWDTEKDGRVAAMRGPAVVPGSSLGEFEQVVVDGSGDGTGVITFIRPVSVAGRAGNGRGLNE